MKYYLGKPLDRDEECKDHVWRPLQWFSRHPKVGSGEPPKYRCAVCWKDKDETEK